MQSQQIRLLIISFLSILTLEAVGAGSLCTLPSAPVGSAYINAYNDGRVIPPYAGPAVTALQARTNFGTTVDGGPAGLCEITGLANDGIAPLPGYGTFPIVSASRSIPSVTGGSTNIGTVVERIWRKPATATTPAMCILGTKISSLQNVDHDSSLAGTQYFKVNDIARGGYGGLGDINVGYYLQSANTNRTYRIGRTFTSVQHRAYKFGGGATIAEMQNNGVGYLDLPSIGGSPTLAINGVNVAIAPGAVATTGGNPALQEAQINTNWVDFTTDSYWLDWNGMTTSPVSNMNYVEFPCNSDNAATINSTWVKPGAIRLRQTAQENTNFKEISIPGYAPPGATLP
jgi:hypothetical protein